MLPGFANTIPLSTSSFAVPLNNTPILSPALPSSNSFLNISTPVATVFLVSPNPTISTSSPTFTTPLSTLPVTTVPLPDMLNTSSTGIKNGLSVSLSGVGIYSSIAFNTSSILLYSSAPVSSLLLSNAFNADPFTIGISSPGNSYFVSSSLTSISTKSNNSGSSTMSVLFMYTTIYGTPTCLASNMCSLVCGIGPSAADTTSTDPSIWAAPVIMFFI